MKNLKFLAALLFAGILSSCLDTEEKIVLNADHSGTYSIALDLSRMLSMAASMGGDKVNAEKNKQKKDTTIYLKDLISAADNLTPEEKALFKDGSLKIKMDETKNEMIVVMNAPFKNPADLVEIKKSFIMVVNKLQAFEKATGDEPKQADEPDEMKTMAKSISPVGDQFTFTASPGFVSNTLINIEAFKQKTENDSSLNMIKQMSGMMGDFNFRTIIVLPKAVKNFSGPGSSVSADKKTINFSTTLTETLEQPEKVSYKVAY